MRNLIGTASQNLPGRGRLAWLLTVLGFDGAGRRPWTDWSTESVLWRYGDVEVRHVPQAWVAETLVRGDAEGARSKGIRRLESYVLGANNHYAPLPAGSFVNEEPVRDDLWRVWLSLRGETELCGIPRPTNPKVRVSEHPSREIAVARFKGCPTPEMVSRLTDQVASALVGTVWRCSGQWGLRTWRPLGIIIPIRRMEMVVTLVRDSGPLPRISRQTRR